MPIDQLIGNIETYILNPIIVLAFGIAAVVFLWGVFEMIAGAGNEDKRTIGRKHILWGVIGMAIMLSAWGIFGLIENTVCDGPCGQPSEQIDF